MNPIVIRCDQAIFTSIRTPMGEGYRIVAASKGVRPEEKQAITQKSPSHEGLCQREDKGLSAESALNGFSFYELPTGRLCVALSSLAGAEHTGRGGQRVYTHAIVFDAQELSNAENNPFHLCRAMIRTELSTPQLKPSNPLEEIELSVELGSAKQANALSTLASPFRKKILQDSLEGRNTILNFDGDWIAMAEVLLLGIPGALRKRVSIGAGMRFSMGRCHCINLLFDPKDNTRTKSAGQQVDYIDPNHAEDFDLPNSQWHAMVDGHWQEGTTTQLADRTNCIVDDASLEARERVARIYNQTDSIESLDTDGMLQAFSNCFVQERSSQEKGAIEELVVAAKGELATRLTKMQLPELRVIWPQLLQISRASSDGLRAATPLVIQAIQQTMTAEPLDALTLMIEFLRCVPDGGRGDSKLHQVTQGIQARIDAMLCSGVEIDLPRLTGLCMQWLSIHPDDECFKAMAKKCNDLATEPASL